MSFDEVLSTFAGRRVVDVPLEGPLPSVHEPVAWRFSLWAYDDERGAENGLNVAFAEAFDRFVVEHGAQVESLVIGSWGYAAFDSAPIEQLCRLAPQLPSLRSLFLGDMTYEECEVSWMQVGDCSRLLDAFADLEVFGVRGGREDDFLFSPVKHSRLRRLIVQSGGLPREFTDAVLSSDLPALTDLELWLGDEVYGGNTTVEDLAPLLTGECLPTVVRLGLCNADNSDQLAETLAEAPVVARLQRLDLSMGTLGDEGVAALLGGQSLDHLEELDLHHHYLSADVAQSVVDALPGVGVDVSQPQEMRDGERYVAVSE